jgi:hypothetical protein
MQHRHQTAGGVVSETPLVITDVYTDKARKSRRGVHPHPQAQHAAAQRALMKSYLWRL